MPDWWVEAPEEGYGPARYSAETPRDAAEAALDAWDHNRDVTYDGEEMDLVVWANEGEQQWYFRGVATVNITWRAAEIEETP